MMTTIHSYKKRSQQLMKRWKILWIQRISAKDWIS
jgi:hypothetical protein